MNYGNIKKLAIEDGIGCRTALFVSGCRHHCKGCFQPQTWNFDFGQEFTKETEAEIIDSVSPSYVDGLTVLGGEPFEPENQVVLNKFLKKFKKACPDKTIWMYSGYTFEELTDPNNKKCHTKATMQILKRIDVLVDGEFVEEKKNLMIPFRGSSNQRVLDVPASLKAKTAVLSEYNDRKTTNPNKKV